MICGPPSRTPTWLLAGMPAKDSLTVIRGCSMLSACHSACEPPCMVPG